MLDQLCEVAYEAVQEKTKLGELVQDLRRLPTPDLKAIIDGSAEKVAMLFSGDDDGWLRKFEGTPLYERALQLEQAQLAADIDAEKRRLARMAEEDGSWRDRQQAHDVLRLKKRLMDMELNAMKLEELGDMGDMGDEGMVPDVPVQEAPPAEEQAKAAYSLAQSNLELLKKEALGGAVLQGLRGAGQFVGNAAPRLMTAAQKGGVTGFGRAANRVARQGVNQAATWTAANPKAALGLGAAAAGGTFLAGRASRSR